MIYALSLFLQIELVVNTYRMVRVTSIKTTDISIMSDVTAVLLLVITTCAGFYLTKRLFGERKVKYLAAVLWIPYFDLLIKAFAHFFPITDPGEAPLGAVGLIALFYMIGYPIYILVISLVSSIRLEGSTDTRA